MQSARRKFVGMVNWGCILDLDCKVSTALLT